MQTEQTSPAWRTQALIAGVVLVTVLLALLLAQADAVQNRSELPPRRLAVLDVDATAVAGDLAIVALGMGEGSTGAEEPPLPEIDAEEANGVELPLLPGGTPDRLPPTMTAVPLAIACDSIPSGWVAYHVQAGDTLTALAARSGTSVSAIEDANCLKGSPLVPGMLIYLPALVPTIAACGPPRSWVYYTVRRGDTLSLLAVRYGTTVSRLMNANCLENSRINAGQRIFVPPVLPAAPPTATRHYATAVPSPTRIASPTPVPTLVTSTPPPDTPVPGTPMPPPTATAPATTLPPTFTPVPPPTATPGVTAVPPTYTPDLPPPTQPPPPTFTPEPPPQPSPYP